MNTYHPLPPYTPPSSFTNNQRVHFNDNVSEYSPVRSREACPGKNSILPKVGQVIVSIALAAITATVAYYMLQYGFNRLDCAFSRMDMFVGGAMAYMGTAYAVVAFANLCFPCSQLATGHESGNDLLAAQVGISALAPLAFVPAASFFGLQAAISR